LPVILARGCRAKTASFAVLSVAKELMDLAETLHGVYPEAQGEPLRYAQGLRLRRRVQGGPKGPSRSFLACPGSGFGIPRVRQTRARE
jgi:hypothetical protein